MLLLAVQQSTGIATHKIIRLNHVKRVSFVSVPMYSICLSTGDTQRMLQKTAWPKKKINGRWSLNRWSGFKRWHAEQFLTLSLSLSDVEDVKPLSKGTIDEHRDVSCKIHAVHFCLTWRWQQLSPKIRPNWCSRHKDIQWHVFKHWCVFQQYLSLIWKCCSCK